MKTFFNTGSIKPLTASSRLEMSYNLREEKKRDVTECKVKTEREWQIATYINGWKDR